MREWSWRSHEVPVPQCLLDGADLATTTLWDGTASMGGADSRASQSERRTEDDEPRTSNVIDALITCSLAHFGNEWIFRGVAADLEVLAVRGGESRRLQPFSGATLVVIDGRELAVCWILE
jgi:hypothetical protein